MAVLCQSGNIFQGIDSCRTRTKLRRTYIHRIRTMIDSSMPHSKFLAGANSSIFRCFIIFSPQRDTEFHRVFGIIT